MVDTDGRVLGSVSFPADPAGYEKMKNGWGQALAGTATSGTG